MKNSLEDRIIRERERERFLWEEGSKWNTNYRKWVVSVPDPNSRAFHGNQTDRKEKEKSPIELPISARRMGEGRGGRTKRKNVEKSRSF